ncbi:MAG: Gfo/Idh/MocA family oxidoreductase [Blautia massiliensis (ex Durand et al. 2017)]
MCFTKFAWGRKNSQRLEIYGSRGGLIYTLENGLRGSDHLKVCLGNELALTGDWVDMNLKGFDGVYNTKSQMDCFAEKMLGIKNTIPADIEDGYYVQGIIEAMMNSTQSRTWHKVSDYIIK